jgi:zinc transport system substrate-binding protein
MLYHSIFLKIQSTWRWGGAPRRVLAVTAVLAACLWPAPVRAEAPAVVVSIKPIHALVAAVMEGIRAPVLLVKGAASPHSYVLTPSDAESLQQARLIFWIGGHFERFLSKAVATLPQLGVSVELSEIDGLTILPIREGGLWSQHAHEEVEQAAITGEGHDHDPEPFDGHLWLDPANAQIMAAAIVEALSAADPANAATYHANGEKLQARLDSLDAEIASSLAPVEQVPFIVFHDAYQYFEARYGLSGVGSITVTPEQMPGAKRMSEIRDLIAARKARCVFREPNFEPSLVETVVENTGAKLGVLDPEGADLAEGPELYFQLMRAIADSLKACLAANS